MIPVVLFFYKNTNCTIKIKPINYFLKNCVQTLNNYYFDTNRIIIILKITIIVINKLETSSIVLTCDSCSILS